jgi:serine/threonine-protein kinase
VVVLVGSFVTGYLISTQILFPRPETAGTGIAVPSLYGEQRSAAETAIRSAGLEIGEVTELANREVERGRVLAQDPVPGQQLRQGGVVSFAVSGGAPVIRVPPVRGLGVDAARELLDSVGFDVAVGQLRDPRLPAGTVARVEPAAGTQRELPSGVTLFVVPEAVTDSLEPGVAPVGEGGSVPDTGSAGPTPAPRVGDGAG